MAIKRINSVYFKADSVKDLAEITKTSMGMEAYVIEEACEYQATSDGRWIKQIPNTNTTAPGMTDYVTTAQLAEVEAKIPEVKGYIPTEVVNACYRPIQYEISNVPTGTIVDYREKEIRVFCPDGVEFTQQNVGENGNPNMYYMTFKAYAPKGAVSFKEGDRGVIIDEMFDFNASAAGTDKYGRNYSVCWLALASRAEDGTWTYFGKTSTTEKYIGWTYIVEWYDANGVMIGTDKIRINLSNANCHLN